MTKDCESKPNYWLVGANWEEEPGNKSNPNRVNKKFVDQGVWVLGWEEADDKRGQFAKARKIKAGDRIAIKKMKGFDEKIVEIFHLGIVKHNFMDENLPEGQQISPKVICTVDWIATDLNRIVKGKKCTMSIHGPYSPDSEEDGDWVREVFCL